MVSDLFEFRSQLSPADTLYEGAFLKARLSFPEVRMFGPYPSQERKG